jgi:hydroxyethylthiazole kinase-like sugar kinase family protein
MSPEQAKTAPQKQEVKKIGSGKNDIIERADQKVVVEDGRELLK